MGTALLKINHKILENVMAGIKTKEFRKLNKDYIQPGDIITLYPYDLEFGGFEPYQVIVTNKQYVEPKLALAHARDKESKTFIEENYMDELLLVELRFKTMH